MNSHQRFTSLPIALAVLAILSPASAGAEILAQKSRDCGPDHPGARETWTFFKDDCSGKFYSILVTCDGHVWTNVPPDWSVGTFGIGGGYDPFPDNFWETIDRADLKTPGGIAGFYLYNIYGQPVWFRNPYNAQEESAAIAAWQCTGGSLD